MLHLQGWTLQVLYIVAVTVLFPGSILALAAGAVFGLALGSLLVWVGTVLGQTLAFVIGRQDLKILQNEAVCSIGYVSRERGVNQSMRWTDWPLCYFRNVHKLLLIFVRRSAQQWMCQLIAHMYAADRST